jgi:hypothetical protein
MRHLAKINDEKLCIPTLFPIESNPKWLPQLIHSSHSPIFRSQCAGNARRSLFQNPKSASPCSSTRLVQRRATRDAAKYTNAFRPRRTLGEKWLFASLHAARRHDVHIISRSIQQFRRMQMRQSTLFMLVYMYIYMLKLKSGCGVWIKTSGARQVYTTLFNPPLILLFEYAPLRKTNCACRCPFIRT